jgi:hypothetical protein
VLTSVSMARSIWVHEERVCVCISVHECINMCANMCAVHLLQLLPLLLLLLHHMLLLLLLLLLLILRVLHQPPSLRPC